MNATLFVAGSQYVTNSFAQIPIRDSLTNLRKMLAAKFFTSSIMKIKKHLVIKPEGAKTQ